MGDETMGPMFDPAETYALSETGVVRGSDGAHIPEDEGNADWRAFLEWQASGKTASPYQPPPSAPQPETVSWMDFVGLFAPAELMAIATSTDPSVAVFRLMATEYTQQNVAADLPGGWQSAVYDLQDFMTSIDFDDDAVIIFEAGFDCSGDCVGDAGVDETTVGWFIDDIMIIGQRPG